MMNCCARIRTSTSNALRMRGKISISTRRFIRTSRRTRVTRPARRLKQRTPRSEHVHVAKYSLEKLVKFKPDLLLVSAGFDAYARDPLLQLSLEREDFAKFGEWLSNIGVPIAVVLEGGYSDDLPELIDAFLTAWQS